MEDSKQNLDLLSKTETVLLLHKIKNSASAYNAQNANAENNAPLLDVTVLKGNERMLLDIDSCHEQYAYPLANQHSLIIDYIWVCQPEQRMVYMSQQVDSLGYEREKWLGVGDFRMCCLHSSDLPVMYHALQHSCSTGDKFSCNYRLHNSRGEILWFHDEAHVVPDEHGKPLFLRGAMLNITDKKDMESQLKDKHCYINRYLEPRLQQLSRQVELLESCNAALCDKIERLQRELSFRNAI